MADVQQGSFSYIGHPGKYLLWYGEIFFNGGAAFKIAVTYETFRYEL